MFSKIVIVCGGDIARRAVRTCKNMNIASVLLYTENDRHQCYVREADTAIYLGEAPESRLSTVQILAAAHMTGADAVFPGDSILARSAAFADACEEAGLRFIGPSGQQLRALATPDYMQKIAGEADIPVSLPLAIEPGEQSACLSALGLGYPVILEVSTGALLPQTYRCENAHQLVAACRELNGSDVLTGPDNAWSLTYDDPERAILDFQLLGDGNGGIITMGHWQCLLAQGGYTTLAQTPAAGLTPERYQAVATAAHRLAAAIRLRGVASLRFHYSPRTGEYWYHSLRPWIQPLYGMCEPLYGLDMMAVMFDAAADDMSRWQAPQSRTAHQDQVVIGACVYAGHPSQDFMPVPGRVTEIGFPRHVRVESHLETGSEVTPWDSPLLVTLVARGDDLSQTRRRIAGALEEMRLLGIASNLSHLARYCARSEWAGEASVGDTEEGALIEVLAPGTLTTVQDNPGRVGFLDVGVPISGPMDDYGFQLANRIVGNHPSAAGLEITQSGPVLRFLGAATIALTGAECQATLDGVPLAYWLPVNIQPGQVLSIGRADRGCRAYLAVRNGLDMARYLGSRSTLLAANAGGQGGRALQSRDLLGVMAPGPSGSDAPIALPRQPELALIPHYGPHWDIAVLYGPHGAPDFVTPEAMSAFLSEEWHVGERVDRRGISLTGPRGEWASDIGCDGINPASIPEGGHPPGGIRFTADGPQVVSCDSPVIGGYACPLTIASSDLWKLGQMRPGDRIHFQLIDFEHAQSLALARYVAVTNLYAGGVLPPKPPSGAPGSAILARLPDRDDGPRLVVRQAGDRHLLLEYGQPEYQLSLRLRVDALMAVIRARPLDGIEALIPGVRSLLVRYDNQHISQRELVRILIGLDQQLPDTSRMSVPSRIVHLPLAFDSRAVLDSVKRYQKVRRASAPWLVDNIDFLRRINGMAGRQNVEQILSRGTYLVLASGGVAPGSPCAVALDPRHRLRSAPYRPVRTTTPDGTVAFGHCHLTIYTLAAPGDDQLVGRTLNLWDDHRQQSPVGDVPARLRPFDQIRFYPVSEQQLNALRSRPDGGWSEVGIEPGIFDLGAYQQFLNDNGRDIALFLGRQSADFSREARSWPVDSITGLMDNDRQPPEDISPGQPVFSPTPGVIRQILVQPDQTIAQGTALFIVGVMDRVFTVYAPGDGTISALVRGTGQPVTADQPVLWLSVAN